LSKRARRGLVIQSRPFSSVASLQQCGAQALLPVSAAIEYLIATNDATPVILSNSVRFLISTRVIRIHSRLIVPLERTYHGCCTR
jgi:hypothetical protein